MRSRFAGYFLGVVLSIKPSDRPYWTMRGLTEQGEVIRLRLDDRERVRTFEVSADLACQGARAASSAARSRTTARAGRSP